MFGRMTATPIVRLDAEKNLQLEGEGELQAAGSEVAARLPGSTLARGPTRGTTFFSDHHTSVDPRFA